MEKTTIDVSNVKGKMRAFYLVQSIYDVHYHYAEINDIELDRLYMNEKLLNIIDDVNFAYIKDGLEPTEVVKKVGYLLNFHVYLDPNQEKDYIIFTNENKDIIEVDVII